MVSDLDIYRTAKLVIDSAVKVHPRETAVTKMIAMYEKGDTEGFEVWVKSNMKAKYSSATFLANVGILTRIDYKYSIMHSKYMIVDGVTVETGSFNYTKAAENKNAENIIILRNQANIAKKYAENWQKLWDESEELKASY